MATPDDAVNFLVWKDQFRKTVAYQADVCPLFAHKGKSSCRFPTRLPYGTLDSLAEKLPAISILRLVEPSVILCFLDTGILQLP